MHSNFFIFLIYYIAVFRELNSNPNTHYHLSINSCFVTRIVPQKQLSWHANLWVNYCSILKCTVNLLHKEALTRVGEEKESDWTDLYQLRYIKKFMTVAGLQKNLYLKDIVNIPFGKAEAASMPSTKPSKGSNLRAMVSLTDQIFLIWSTLISKL